MKVSTGGVPILLYMCGMKTVSTGGVVTPISVLHDEGGVITPISVLHDEGGVVILYLCCMMKVE